MSTLEQLPDQRFLSTHFQPIVELNRGRIIGYEALTRGPVGTRLESPGALFAEAVRLRAVLTLEERCWQSALDSVARQHARRAPSSRIFLNALPSTLLSQEFARVAHGLVERAQLDPSQIVIEISEGTRIDDFASFRTAISSYRLAGFGVAVDDAGAGHSGLQMMAEIVPDLIKVDAGLVRQLHRHKGRRATVEALLVLARTLAIDVVAEGIECEEELVTLRDLGVQLGQGYFLARPSAEIGDAIDFKAVVGWGAGGSVQPPSGSAVDTIGRLAVNCATVDVGAELRAAVHLFENQHADGIVVVERGAPVGLLMKAHVYEVLGRAYGREVHLRRSVDLVASRQPLVVDWNATLDDVSRRAMAREPQSLYDYIIVTHDGVLGGIVSVQRLLAAITDARVDAARHANPLTGLPGNAMIERELRSRMRASERVALMHIDLDDFKAFNDTYGFHRGDVAITMTAELVSAELTSACENHFLGHIGGDDFLAVVDGNVASAIADRLPREFAKRISALYADEDRRRGWIRVADRAGDDDLYPLMTLSVALTMVEPDGERHYAELLDALSAAKRDVKQRKRERRTASLRLLGS